MNPHPALDKLLNWLVNHSLQAGVLVLLVLAVQWIFRKKLNARWRFALWWIVLARLLLPFNPESALSVFNVFKPVVQDATVRNVFSVPAQIEPQKSEPLPAPSPASPGIKNQTAPILAAPAVAPSAGEKQAAVSPAAKSPELPKRAWNFRDLMVPGLVGIWLAGVTILSGVVMVQVIRFQRTLTQSGTVTDPKLQALLDECRNEFGISRRVEICETRAIQSPALFGLLRLRLLMPQGMAAQFTDHELRYVFLHELAHVKRGDLWLNWVVTTLQIVHWANPLVWFGFARLRADRELACDELALLRAGDNVGTAYGETIIKLLQSLSRPAAIPGLVGILEDRRQMRRRISMIASFRKTGRWSLLAGVLLAVVAAVALTDAQSSTPAKTGAKAMVSTAEAQEQNTNGLKMTITVLDAKTGQPIAGAALETPYVDFLNRGSGKQPNRVTDERGMIVLSIPQITNYTMQNFDIGVNATNYASRSAMWIAESGKVMDTLPDHYTFHMVKGVTVGGYVRDEQGQPLAGVKVTPWGSGYLGFSMGAGVQSHQEYSEVPRYVSGITTDARGFWKMDNFPTDLDQVRVDVVRPGGGRSEFTTDGGKEMLSVEEAEVIPLADLLATNLTLVVKDGYSIRGIVVDQTGKAVSGVKLRARGGRVEQTPVYVLTNNTDGRFELNHWTVPQFVLTAEAEGFAQKSIVVSATDSGAEQRIVLPPAQPLRVRVLGEQDEPVAGATFQIVTWRSGEQLLDWKGKTDANGAVVWTNAPDQPVTFEVNATNYPGLTVKLLADGTEKTVRLRHGTDKEITLHLSVQDAVTGLPVPAFAVQRSLQWNNDFQDWGAPGTNGEFAAKIKAVDFTRLGTVTAFKLQIIADNHQPWASDDLYFDEGDQNITVKLARGESSMAMVRQPDGRPAADAKVIFCLTEGSSLFLNSPDHSYPGQGSVTERTAADGSFKIISTDDARYIVVSHPSGFAHLTVGELRRAKEIKLLAWSSVEGVVRQEGKPVANEYVSVQAPLSWESLEGFNLVYMMRTDANGHFLFTNLPAGDCLLFRDPHIVYGTTTLESHRWPLELKPGERKQVDYTFGGRQVAGHVETTVPVDWQNDNHVLAAKVTAPPAGPTYWSYVNKTDYERARQAFTHSPEFLEYERKQQQFQVVFDENGNFHADDVPPGDYELQLHVTLPPKSQRDRFSLGHDELGSLTQDVHVPAGSGPFDLGTFNMAINPLPNHGTEPAKMAMLKGKDFDGKPVTLEQFKGKYTLLVFWASWSDRSAEQMAEVAKLQSEFGANGKFTIFGVNVDGNAASAQQWVKAHGYTWPEAWLDESALATASADFNINSLPSYSLIGPDGRIVAHDLEHNLVGLTVQRALKTN